MAVKTIRVDEFSKGLEHGKNIGLRIGRANILRSERGPLRNQERNQKDT